VVFETTTGFPEESTTAADHSVITAKLLAALAKTQPNYQNLTKNPFQQVGRSIYINNVNIVVPPAKLSSAEDLECDVPVCICRAGIAHPSCTLSNFECRDDHVREVSTCIQCLEGFELVKYNNSGIYCNHSEQYCETYCDPYKCECEHGKPFVGHGCYRHGQQVCDSCVEGFILQEKQCKTKKSR